MNRLNKLEVFYHERLVGTIALYQNRLAAFEYDSNWLANGFSISPFPLPLEKKVFIPKIDPFEGLLETSHRIPNLDYDILMQLTLQLTRSMEECEKLYKKFNEYSAFMLFPMAIMYFKKGDYKNDSKTNSCRFIKKC